jgi:hypothetical protein
MTNDEVPKLDGMTKHEERMRASGYGMRDAGWGIRRLENSSIREFV